MKLAPARVDGFLRRPPDDIAVALVYGPDRGLVRERCRGLMTTIAGSADDPFRAATLEAGDISGDPARLVDEAAAGSLVGGRRAIRVRDAADAVTAAVETCLDQAAGSTLAANLIVLEGPADLPPRSALRRLCEAAPAAVAIACYPAEGGALIEEIRRHLDAAGVRADRDVLVALADRLGADHAVMRGELEKLVCFVGDRRQLTAEDVSDCLGDGAQASLDALAIAVTEGAVAVVDRACRRLAADGVAPVRIVRAVQRHVDRLRMASLLAAAGHTEQAILARLRIFFKQQPAFRRLQGSWPRAACQAALDRLFALELACKQTGIPAEIVLRQELLTLSREAAGRIRPSRPR